MKQCLGKWPIGVCSWSFRSDIPSISAAMRDMGIDRISLALQPALEAGGADYLKAARGQGWIIISTMLSFAHEDYSSLEAIRRTGGVAPDAEWPTVETNFARAAVLTAELGVPYITAHVGFLNHADPAYAAKFTRRVRRLADAARANGIMLLMETGQESADELLLFLKELDHPAVALNLDPANLILYNKDEPLRALRKLAPYVRQVHAKDAIRTKVPGQWGQEVPWGDGEVDTAAFLRGLDAAGFAGALAIEREAGEQRAADIALAARRLSEFGK